MKTSFADRAQGIIACLRKHNVRTSYRLVNDILKSTHRSGGWSETPPDCEGWWWWCENAQDEPIPVHIQRSPAGRRYYASTGQHGWTQAKWSDEMGGVWQRSNVQRPVVKVSEVV